MKQCRKYYIISGILLVSGLLLIFYPVVSSFLAKRQQENVIVGYENAVSSADKNRIKKEWEKADSFKKNNSNYMDVLNINQDGVMGYLEIPKIEVRIPIYHCATEETLSKGAGHIEQTALPIGKKGNHPVITGHRGLPEAKMFTRLDELRAGDLFYLYVLDKVFTYKVSQTSVVLPEKINDIEEKTGKDLVTLVTCTPYGVNTHRLLVTGERVEGMDKLQKEEVDNIKGNKIMYYIIIIFTGVAVLLYPYLTNRMYDHRIEKQKIQFIDRRPRMYGKYEALYQELNRRNEELFETEQKAFSSLSSCERNTINLKLYGIKDNIIGYISIPKMKIELPVYPGASESNMKLGAVHLTETSYPIGGNNTNCVIAAHRGYSKAAMFREIERLEKGDRIYINNFREKLCYKVVEIRIISPDDTEKIMIQEGRDLVTLMTCHPYRKNFQRYVVFCERIL